MKFIYYFLFLSSLFIPLFKCLDFCFCETSGGTTVKDCNKCDSIGSFCCLQEYRTKDKKEEKSCVSLTQSMYDNIDETIAIKSKAIEAIKGTIYGFSIDCYSNYIKVSILVIMLFLF